MPCDGPAMTYCVARFDMRRDFLLRALVPVVICSTFAACRPSAPTAEERNTRLAKEIDRLQATLGKAEATGLPEEVKPLVGEYRKALDLARKASTPDLRLYRLRDPFVGIETLAFVAENKASGASLEKFSALWRTQATRFGAKSAQPRGTLLQRALCESAATRAERLYRASLPYAKASAPWLGVYYLGEAEGNARFGTYIRSIAEDADEAAERSPSFDRLAAARDALQGDTLTFFAADVTNQNVIPVSVRLKEASELLAARRLAGATLLLVEARVALSRRGGPAGHYPAGTGAAAGSMQSLLDAWAAGEEPPMKEAFRTQVTPFFASLQLPAAVTTKRPASVVVTLVRWPYT